MMQRIFLTTLSALALSTAAHSADLSTPDSFIWDGAYVGGHIGYGSLNGDMTAFTPFNGFNGFPVSGLDGSSFLGGVQLGYNYQMDNIVLGLEGDFSWMSVSEGSTNNPPGTLFTRDLDWTATIAPRIGFAQDQWLLYVKGGLALGGFDVGHQQQNNFISASSTELGYMLGAGIEYAIDSNWSVKLEYNYLNFGDDEIDINSNFGPDISVEQGGDLHAVKVGVNYRF